MYETRDIIKNRMMAYLSNLWGTEGHQSEDAFDPVLGMILGACAVELEGVSKHLDASTKRLTEQLAMLFVPETELRATPAHSVVHMPMCDVEGNVNQNTVLHCRNRIISPDNVLEEKLLNFLPTYNAKMHNAEIKYLISKDYWFEQIDGKFKSTVGYPVSSNTPDSNVLYLGINLKSPKDEIEELSIYFDIDAQYSNSKLLTDNIKYARFYNNEDIINFTTGIGEEDSDKGVIEKIRENKNLIDKKMSEVNEYYSPSFVSLKDIKNIKENLQVLPQELENVYDEEITDGLSEELMWLRIEFPSFIKSELLNHVSCHLNCVPIINCKQNKDGMQLQEQLNIKALVCEDYFYDIRNIEDTDGNIYNMNDYLKKDKDSEKVYEFILRNSGVSRLNKRQASEMLTDLVDVLKEESLAFSMFNTNKLNGNVSRLNEQIIAFENQIKNQKAGESINYIMLNGHKEEENKHLFIYYWETSGQQANGIKKGSDLTISKDALFIGQHVTLMQRSHGGRGYLNGTEKIDALKKSHIMSNRVVTLKDVEECVKSILDNKAKSVVAKKTLLQAVDQRQGFIRAIEVRIAPDSAYFSDDPEERKNTIRQIETQLRDNSPAMLNFDIIIE